MVKNEEWHTIFINNEKTKYKISSLGRVYSEYSNKILKPDITKNGYLRISLYHDGGYVRKSIHRLVALAFIPNLENKPDVNHKDGNKNNNTIDNLEWNTVSENNYHAYRTGLKVSKYGNESHLSIYDKKDVEKACEMMEEGIYTIQEIHSVTKISPEMLYNIRLRKSWINISYKYDVENCKASKNKYIDVQMEHVFMLLEEDKLSLYDISDITGVKTSTITNIINKRNVSKFLYLYDMYDISKYHSNKQMPDIDKHVKNKIKDMINKGLSNKEISEYIHDKYEYNEDRIRHFTHRLRKRIGSTTIERIA